MIRNDFPKYDLTHTERVPREMWMIESRRHWHISKEIAQSTIETELITDNLPAVTLCGQTWTSGFAYEMNQPLNIHKVCKVCNQKKESH
jgi:hypothetical protein